MNLKIRVNQKISSSGNFLVSIDLIKLHRWEHGMEKKNFFGLPSRGPGGLKLVDHLEIGFMVFPDRGQ